MNSPEPDIGTTAIALEFVIGVTGHRDCLVEDTMALKASVTAALVDLKNRFSQMPVRVVTGLAEGADTLVTEVALDLGMAVSAVLPMPRAEYENDFKDAARSRFLALLDDPRLTVHELPLATEGAAGGAARVAQYEMLMDYLVRRANVLLALWDGKMVADKGGTSDVIARYLSGYVDGRATPLDRTRHVEFEDCGDLAIWIRTPRAGSDKSLVVSDPICLVSDSAGLAFIEMPKVPQQFKTRWQGLEAYAKERFSQAGAALAAYPLGHGDETPQAAAINREFLRADQLAMANQKSSDGLFKGFGLIAAAMGLFFLIYAKMAAEPVFLVIYILLFVMGFLLFKLGDTKHWLSHHLAYRALAETMRVQYFMQVSGAGRNFSVRRVMSLTSVDRFVRFEWLRDAVRCMEPLSYARNLADAGKLEAVRQNWIVDQSDYFTRKLGQLHHQHRRLERIRTTLMLGSIVGAFALIGFMHSLHEFHLAGFDGKVWLVFLMGLLPLWVAVWELYQNKMATREMIWQYANQRRYFVAARNQMETTQDVTARLHIVEDLAQRALAEIYLWSATRFHREHEPPTAG